MDWSLMKSVNAEYPLSRRNVPKYPIFQFQFFDGLRDPLKCVAPPKNGTII